MVYVFIKYKINPDDVAEAKEAVCDLTESVKKKEPGTLKYESFRMGNDENEFFHVISFSDQEAKELHENSSYFKHFLDTLCPMCQEGPEFTELKLIDTNAMESERLISALRNKARRL